MLCNFDVIDILCNNFCVFFFFFPGEYILRSESHIILLLNQCVSSDKITNQSRILFKVATEDLLWWYFEQQAIYVMGVKCDKRFIS